MKKMLIIIVCILLAVTISLFVLNKDKIDVNSLDNIGKDFYAKIKEINEYNGITTLLVEGIEENSINYRGEFTFTVNDTEIFWNNEKVNITSLKENQIISIVSFGEIMEIYPARLTKVKKIIILNNKI